MLLIFLVFVLFVVSVFIVTPLIWCGLGKILRIENLTFKKAIITCLLLSLIGIAFQIIPLGLALFKLDNDLSDFILSITGLVVAISILKIRFDTTVLRSIVLHFSTLVFTIILALTIRTYITQAFNIPSGAMKNTILIGDHILVNKFYYRFNHPMHGDIIVFKYPNDPSKDFIKRVVAVGGDTVEIRNKKVYVNGSVQDTDFTIYSDSRTYSDPNVDPKNYIRRDNLQPTKIPAEKLFVMGDNRDESNDSRFWGMVDESAVRGKAFIIYWSWDKNASSVRWDRIGESL